MFVIHDGFWIKNASLGVQKSKSTSRLHHNPTIDSSAIYSYSFRIRCLDGGDDDDTVVTRRHRKSEAVRCRNGGWNAERTVSGTRRPAFELYNHRAVENLVPHTRPSGSRCRPTRNHPLPPRTLSIIHVRNTRSPGRFRSFVRPTKYLTTRRPRKRFQKTFTGPWRPRYASSSECCVVIVVFVSSGLV